jgi:signal transduction histidine kinase
MAQLWLRWKSRERRFASQTEIGAAFSCGERAMKEVRMVRILVVENDADDAEALRSVLKDHGFEPDMCSDAKAGLSLFNPDAHALAICNVSTPDMSGYDFCRKLKHSDQGGKARVILLKQADEPIDITLALASEADQFVAKPFDGDYLVAQIRAMLGPRQNGDAHAAGAIDFLGRTFATDAQKQRLLRVLVASFGDYVTAHQQLDDCRTELAAVKDTANALANELDRRVKDGVLEEIERRELLFQSQKMESLGDLASGLAHDFNNVLTVVVGNLDTLIAELKGNARAERIGNTALEAALRGAELTRQLLLFSRKQPLAPRVLDLNETIASMAQMLTASLGEKVKLEVDCDDDLWPVTVDPAQLQVAITNLSKNAGEAMPQGGKLRIETHNVSIDARIAASNIGMTPGDYCLLSISDTGEGIAPEVMPRVFEPLFSTKNGERNAGLGLSVVFGFVRQSGGHIRIESEASKGTSVRIYLPRAKVEAARTTQRSAKAARLPSGDETILVVEDDEGVRRTVVQQLRQLGYRVLEADRAASALSILDRNEAIDLLFTDIIMPGGMSGRDLGHKAALLRPSLKVLYTSGYMRGLRDDHRLEPTDVFIGKPFRLHELAQKVREALGQQTTRTAAQS